MKRSLATHLGRSSSPLAHVCSAGAALLWALACAPTPAAQSAAAAPQLAPPVSAFVPDQSQVDRSRLPAAGPMAPWALAKFARLKLASGVDALYLEQGPAPLVSLRLVIPRGAATDPPGADGLTTLMTDLLDEGAGKRSALQLSGEFQNLATVYDVSVTTDEVVFELDGLADNFEASVALLADVLRRPHLVAREFHRRKDDLLAEALANKAEPGQAVLSVTRRALFGEGYAGQPSAGTTRSLKTLTLAQVKKHYDDLIQPTGATFVVTGGIDSAKVQSVLDAAFGDWRGQAQTAPRALSAALPKAGVYFVDFPGSSQSVVMLATRAENEHTDVLFPATIFNRALGGAFTSRINMNLREDKGYTYGASSVFARWRSAGMYFIQATVKADTTRPSLDEVTRELTDVCKARPLVQKERDDAVNGLLLGFPSRFERNSAVADKLAELVADERGDDWYARWPELVRAVSLEQTRTAAQRYCTPANYVFVVAGDKQAVGPSLQGLNLPLFEYDAEGYPKEVPR